MRKADRLFQLVNLIRVHQPVTAAFLAERLEVSVRTVYRYIDDISASGIPVYGEAGRGYTLSEGFELPPLTLSDDELEALTLSVDMMPGRRLSPGACCVSTLDLYEPAKMKELEPGCPVTLSRCPKLSLRHLCHCRRHPPECEALLPVFHQPKPGFIILFLE